MEQALVDEIDAQAEREDRSRNWTINDLVRRGLATVGIEEGTVAGMDVTEAAARYADELRDRHRLDPRTTEEKLASVAGPTPDPEIETSAKPHRHRFQIEVEGSRQGRAGVVVADYACSCGEIKKGLVVR